MQDEGVLIGVLAVAGSGGIGPDAGDRASGSGSTGGAADGRPGDVGRVPTGPERTANQVGTPDRDV
jgi:hypothetical protein